MILLQDKDISLPTRKKTCNRREEVKQLCIFQPIGTLAIYLKVPLAHVFVHTTRTFRELCSNISLAPYATRKCR